MPWTYSRIVHSRLVAKLFVTALRLTRLESLYLVRRVAPPTQDGWFRSFAEKAPVDREGDPIPWYSYPAIEFLRTRIRTEMTVFEYGSGNSTLWWAKRVAQVVSVEHDRAWRDRVAAHAPANVALHHVPLDRPGEYAATLLREGRRFDIVVIDGRERVECTRGIVKGLTDTGVVVFDNSDRADYAEGYAALAAQGFKRIDFVGMAPIVADKITTSIFYRHDNCFGI